jgi:hypothetical protein
MSCPAHQVIRSLRAFGGYQYKINCCNAQINNQLLLRGNTCTDVSAGLGVNSSCPANTYATSITANWFTPSSLRCCNLQADNADLTTSNSNLQGWYWENKDCPGSSIINGIRTDVAGQIDQFSCAALSCTPSQCTPPVPRDPPSIVCAPDQANNGSVTWQWDAVSGADRYEVTIVNADTTLSVNGPGWHTSLDLGCNGGGQCNYLTQLPAGNYYSLIRAQGPACSGSPVGQSNTVTIPGCQYQIGGNKIYLDNDGAAVSYIDANGNSRCHLPAGLPALPGIQPGLNSSISVLNTASGVLLSNLIDGNGNYSTFNVSSGNYLVELNITDPAQYFCSCPGACKLPSKVGPNSDTTADFFVSNTRDSWFQVQGGDVHAQAAADALTPVFYNPVPFSCELFSGCKPYTITRNSSGDQDTSGILSYVLGIVNTWSTSTAQTKNATEDPKDPPTGINRVVNSEVDGRKQNYDFFYHLANFPLNPISDWGTGAANLTSTSQVTSTPPANPGSQAYFHSGNLNITGNIHIQNGQSAIIFVDGSVTQTGRTQVDNGGFLSIIATGDIVFDPSLNSDLGGGLTAPVVEGIYLTNGTIIVQGNGTADTKFIAEGSFIGWDGIKLKRDYNSRRNNGEPAMVFTFRPDIVLNTPDMFKYSQYQWLLVPP